jgi:hypothetical protein
MNIYTYILPDIRRVARLSGIRSFGTRIFITRLSGTRVGNWEASLGMFLYISLLLLLSNESKDFTFLMGVKEAKPVPGFFNNFLSLNRDVPISLYIYIYITYHIIFSFLLGLISDSYIIPSYIYTYTCIHIKIYIYI